MGGSFADDVLGFDPNGGGIYDVPVVGGAIKYAKDNPLQALAIGLGGYGLYGALGSAAAGASEAALLSADAAQLAAQGLSEAQIAQTLGYAGADALAAADAAQLAAQGLGASQIESILAQQTLAPTSGALSPSLSIKDALQGARMLSSMTGTPQTGLPASSNQQAASQRGAVDYSALLGLLSQKPQAVSLLGTQFQPASIDIAQLLSDKKSTNLLG